MALQGNGWSDLDGSGPLAGLRHFLRRITERVRIVSVPPQPRSDSYVDRPSRGLIARIGANIVHRPTHSSLFCEPPQHTTGAYFVLLKRAITGIFPKLYVVAIDKLLGCIDRLAVVLALNLYRRLRQCARHLRE